MKETVLIKVRLVLLATKSNAVIGTLGGGRNAIYPKDNIIVVILTNLVGWSSQVLLKK
jgi:hypothetical protein